MTHSLDTSKSIAAEALRLGFTACAILPVEEVNEEHQLRYAQFIAEEKNADMTYLERNTDVRFRPSLLLEGAASMVILSVNYAPSELQPEGLPRIARFAYGRNYHKTIKQMQHNLYIYIQQLLPEVQGRTFVDSAPFLERYWAVQGQLGFIGRNRQLIDSRRGSYHLLCELILDVTLTKYSTESQRKTSCGTCDKCIKSCPSGALTQEGFDARRCLSYLTIESQSAQAAELHGQLFGCDSCQTVCPFNRFSVPTTISDFAPREFLLYDAQQWRTLGEEGFKTTISGSSLMRAGYRKLLENLGVAEVE